MIIVSSWFLRWFTGGFASGIALYPFIIIKNAALKDNPQFVNHERIHLRQQLELLILPFYIWYFAEYFVYRIKGMSHEQAYLNISFEKEAYENDCDLEYLKKRRWWAFYEYIG